MKKSQLFETLVHTTKPSRKWDSIILVPLYAPPPKKKWVASSKKGKTKRKILRIALRSLYKVSSVTLCTVV